ncbi:MAG: hypothetical protein KAI24_25820 [Planctomycetes bacterium]|nr:hypothetical protein [Planctomycetota bacterium]
MKAPLPSIVPVLMTLAFAACGQPEPAAATATAPRATAPAAREVVDAELAPYRRELLQLAFDAASKFPRFPHHKNRGRTQELVLEACFELGLPKLALHFAPDAEGFRRGLAYADFAFHSARQGVLRDVDRYLRLAEQVIAEESAAENVQAWRVDKVRLKVARALAAAGRSDQAGEVAATIDAASRGAVDAGWTATVASKVADLTLAQAEQHLEDITDSFAGQSLGEQCTSLAVLGALHGRFFAAAELRAAVEERLLDRFVKLPARLRLDAIEPLVGHYLANERPDGARDVVVRMAELVASVPRWRPEDKLPELARIAALHGELGDVERARRELEQALAYYHEHRDEIFDVYRCDALRPVALAFHAIGDRQRGLDLLALGVEEAVENPNSRPRCDDLVET